MNMVLESATTWAFDYGSAGRPGSYRVTPYLATDPGTGALTLTWTTAPVGASGLWGNPVFGYGAVGDPDLPPRPDAAFSLPLLYEPYRVHTGLDDNLDVILASPDFATWECDEQKVCRPLPAVDPGQELTVDATVHNYALTDLNASPSRPLVVRFYLGDPARGGYVIDEQEITEPIPPRGDAQVTAHWTPPAGFAGQPGQPVYAVLDPGGLFDEVFDQTQPIHLWDRALRGKLATASTQVVDGTPVYVFRTEVDHGLLVGNRVKISGMGGYNSKSRVLSTTATTFTLPAKGSPAPLQQRGRWFSAQNDSCMTNNPWYGNAIKDFYSFGTEGSKEFQSTCPTSNNEAYFLTPRVTGNRGAVSRTDLSIASSSIKVARDGRGVVAKVASTDNVVDVDVMLRAWVCATPTEVCSPTTADPNQGYEDLRTLTIPAGGTVKVKLPVTGSLGAGKYRVAFQVLPLSVWERPAGPGVVGAANGQYDNNAAMRLVTRK